LCGCEDPRARNKWGARFIEEEEEEEEKKEGKGALEECEDCKGTA